MVNLHIPMSYNTWSPSAMKVLMRAVAYTEYNTEDYNDLLNRNTRSLIIEWWIHNLGYYLTLPFCKNSEIYKINVRFRDVDLERWE